MIIATKGISKLSNRELKLELMAMPPVEDVKKYLQEAHKRNYQEPFEIAARDPKVIQDAYALKQILNSINATLPSDEAYITLKTLLSHSPDNFEGVKNELMSILNKSPHLVAYGLLFKGTPTDVIYNIIDKYNLNIPSKAVMATPDMPNDVRKESDTILFHIVNFMKSEGIKWENKDSGVLLTTRLIQNNNDVFITEISKYNINIVLAEALLNASHNIRNPTLKDNLNNNHSNSIEIAKIFTIQSLSTEALPILINSFRNSDVDPELIWNGISNKIKLKDWSVKELFSIEENNVNIVELLINHSDNILSEIAHMLVSYINERGYSDLTEINSVEDFVNYCLNHPSVKDIILQLPQTFFGKIRMTQQDREMVREHFEGNIVKEDIKEDDMWNIYKGIIGNQTNWYDKYSSNNS